MIENNLRDSKVLIGLNDINVSFFNIYKLDLLSNHMQLLLNNSRFMPDFVIDNNLNVRLVMEVNQDGSLIYYRFCIYKTNNFLCFNYIKYYRLADEANPNNLTSEKHNWIEYLRVTLDDYVSTQ